MTRTLRFLALAWSLPNWLLPNPGQAGQVNPLSTVKRIYVTEDFGKKTESSSLRKDLVNDLKQSKAFEVVTSPSQADAVLTGSAEVYVKNYFSLNPRAGVSPRGGEPVYGGSVSVELKDKNGETLWSYLSASRSGMANPSHDLAKDIVKHLVIASNKAATR